MLTDVRESGASAISRIEPSSGQLLWSVPIRRPPTSYHLVDGRLDRFVLVEPTGEVQVYDASTGRMLRSMDTLPGDRSASQRVQVVGDLLLLIRPAAPGW
ncbi:hypothetical protein NKG94_24155 [Micromonospora sp. M12]